MHQDENAKRRQKRASALLSVSGYNPRANGILNAT